MSEMAAVPILNTSVMPDIMIPGRGSEPDPRRDDMRVISRMAQQRIDTLGLLLGANEQALERGAWQSDRDGVMRKPVVGILGGYARGNRERPPADPRNTEASINFSYAVDTGLVRHFGNYVRFFKQPKSYSTMTDFAYAWRWWNRYGLPRQPGEFYTPENPLIVIAQNGPAQENDGLDEEAKKRSGHMGRCLDAAHLTGRIAYNALLPVVAPGEDVPAQGRSEADMRRQMQQVMTGVRGWRDAVLREKLVFAAVETKQRLGAFATRH